LPICASELPGAAKFLAKRFQTSAFRTFPRWRSASRCPACSPRKNWTASWFRFSESPFRPESVRTIVDR
jgi:hypothetical protein